MNQTTTTHLQSFCTVCSWPFLSALCFHKTNHLQSLTNVHWLFGMNTYSGVRPAKICKSAYPPRTIRLLYSQAGS